MRKELKPFLNKKVEVKSATVERYGLAREYIGGDSVTILFKNIEVTFDGKAAIVEHAWLKAGKWFENADLAVGSSVSMNCHVIEYTKGYFSYREGIDDRHVDIGLNRASKIETLTQGEGQTMKQYLKSKQSSGHFISKRYNLA